VASSICRKDLPRYKDLIFRFQTAACSKVSNRQHTANRANIRWVAVYLETHCNIGSKRAFPNGILDRWPNCLLIYWRTTCLISAFDDITCLWLSDASASCRVTYFQFPIQSAFLQYITRLSCTSTAAYCWFHMQYQTSDDAKNLGRYLSCAQRASQGKNCSDSNFINGS